MPYSCRRLELIFSSHIERKELGQLKSRVNDQKPRMIILEFRSTVVTRICMYETLGSIDVRSPFLFVSSLDWALAL